MIERNTLWIHKIKWLVAFVLLSACVDRINFDVPSATFLTIVEGMVSDAPGPYTVKVSTSIGLNADSSFRQPIKQAKIKLYDDEGNVEDLSESSPGVYVTGGIIQGQVGHSYYVHIETLDGKTFESSRDTIHAVGEVEKIKFEFEPRTIHYNYGDVDANVFNIYIDANGGPGDNNYVRWRYTGIYKIVTKPELHMTFGDDAYYRTPVPCSGYDVIPALGGGKLFQVGPCTCCECWIYEYEFAPNLSDKQFVSNGEFRNIKVGEATVNSLSFTDKYCIQVEQMSLTRSSYRFFNSIRAQKEGASNIFQPPFGEIKGNVVATNSNESIVGLFWATSVTTKRIFILPSDVPYILAPPDFIPNACTIFSNSSNIQPNFWQ